MSKHYESIVFGDHKYVFYPTTNVGTDNKGHCLVKHMIENRCGATITFEWVYWQDAWLWRVGDNHDWNTPDQGVIEVLERFRRDILNDAADEVLLDEENSA